ncbi:hypothetical protein J2855_002175 [Agrobacterium tumefaciens]|uniref:hypothetical protein n=1 Tax=Agrobacterium tumefaciens TaxID=358 RepID=UPI001AE62F51|nr:hypothetical protein [Agrobacterium tumefaciens]MBP2508540.1 hypothetical protein [Agrobacterium tumefaciens]MBP2517692.1 hypothetical protein [Agrobacterium tumefaciens]MBP2576326.1 hypothetical protein [Agrobacterium tumefaciens]MBP2594682.1 hypothetical protein [Agrobacterium tumefaciens]
MASKLTKFSVFSDVDVLSEDTVFRLSEAGFEKLGDMDEIDFARVEACAASNQEVKVLYNAGIKSGAEFILSPDRPVAALPSVSARVAKELHEKGYTHLKDFSGVYFPDIYGAIGYSAGKNLLLALRLADIDIKFQRPDLDEEGWRAFVLDMVVKGLVSWEDVAVAVCGELNPPQVGTQVANAVKHNYPRGKAMREVWKWLYDQSGRCAISGKRLFLEADHKESKEQFLKSGRDVKEADRLENFQLLTKRENVIKRGSHRLGGLSFAPAASVLIYILLEFKPKTIKEFIKICRSHGLTMSEIRMQEAWAFAIWLSRDGLYEIEAGAVDEAVNEGPVYSEELSDDN